MEKTIRLVVILVFFISLLFFCSIGAWKLYSNNFTAFPKDISHGESTESILSKLESRLLINISLHEGVVSESKDAYLGNYIKIESQLFPSELYCEIFINQSKYTGEYICYAAGLPWI